MRARASLVDSVPRIVELHQKGVSARAIALRLEVSQRFVSDTLARELPDYQRGIRQATEGLARRRSADA